jgi:hypothetical protein
MSPVVGIAQRIPELGRIRAGKKGSKGQPQRLESWRLTSAYKDVLEKAATIYGGSVVEWDGQWELVTTSNTLDVTMPRIAEPISQWYEEWGRSGLVRRCTGEAQHPSGEACVCSAENRKCSLITRTNFILSQIDKNGLWRMESHGINAAMELPGVFSLVQDVVREGKQVGGHLILQSRGSGAKSYIVPVLRLDIVGEDAGTTLQSATQPEILTPEPPPPVPVVPAGVDSLLAGAIDNGVQSPPEDTDSRLPVSSAPQPPVGDNEVAIISKDDWTEIVALAKHHGLSKADLQNYVREVSGKVSTALTPEQAHKVKSLIGEHLNV